MKKPFGVIALSLLNAIISIPVLIGSCSMMIVSGMKDAPPNADLFGFLGMIFSSVALAIAYGLWTLQNWGRRLEIATSYLGIALFAVQFLGIFSFPNTDGRHAVDFAYLIASIVSIIYCSMSSVKERFTA